MYKRQLHAAFIKESRTRNLGLAPRRGDPGSPLTNCCHVDGAGNGTSAFHEHLPERTLQMLNIRFPNTLQSGLTITVSRSGLSEVGLFLAKSAV